MANKRQRDKIIKLYEDGNTFKTVSENMEVRIPNWTRGFYAGIATAGKLSREQALRILAKCNPPDKCENVLEYIATQVGLTSDDVDDVREILIAHFNSPPES